MKVRMKRNVFVDIDKTRLHEVWPYNLLKNTEVTIEKIEPLSLDVVNLVLSDGDVLLEVPSDSFEPVH